MVRDILDVFSGTVEIDETYIGGQWKNKRKSHKAIQAKRGRGTQKTPCLVSCAGMVKYGLRWLPILKPKCCFPL